MITIGIGEYAITDNTEEQIVTHALGSCVALVLYCPISRCGAMAHIVLPSQDKNHRHMQGKEAYYADDVVPRLLDFYMNKALCHEGALKVAIVGGAVSRNKNDVFKVGKRNVERVKAHLNAYGLSYDDSEVLGSFSRTVTIDIKSGQVTIKKQQMLL